MKTEREIELEKIVSELTRKLAEQQAINKRLQAMTGSIVNPWEELNKLLSEAREEGRKEAVQEWMPIETAPKDCRILLGRAGYPWVFSAQWNARHSHWSVGYSLMDFFAEPTHWMPLPAAPSPARLNAREGGE